MSELKNIFFEKKFQAIKDLFHFLCLIIGQNE